MLDVQSTGALFDIMQMPILTAYPRSRLDLRRTGPATGRARPNPMAVTMSAATQTVTAHFTRIPYTFSTSVVGQGTISKSPDQATYYYGDQVTVTATPATGWSFTVTGVGLARGTGSLRGDG